jgi:autotransporter translocation and assembly factor TamB
MAEQEKDNSTENIPAAPKPVEQKKPLIKRSLFHKIVNVFIGIALGLIITILIFLGFTQTSTFRGILREKVIALLNNETNGRVNIEKIDGTIFTSLFLRNTSIVVDKDTLLYARNIEIKTSPLQLLLKKIYVRKILLENVKIAMLQDSAGLWNYSKFLKPKPEDNSKSSFPFMIQVNDFQLHNVSLTRQSYTNLKSVNVYNEMNFDDLRIKDLYFDAQAFVDIDNSNYLLILKEFSFKPNLNRFKLKNISGEIAVTKNFSSITNFNFITDSSRIKMNVRLDSLDLFGKVSLEDFKNYPVSIDIKARPFNFDDLSSFIGSTEILKGSPSLELKAHGKFGGFKIDKCILDYRNTHFDLDGKLLNLNKPQNIFIQAKINNTDIDYKDVNVLLPTLKLPEYAKLEVRNSNLEFEGEPTNFKSTFIGNIDEGKVKFEAALNLKSSPMNYNIKFETENLNLAPVLEFNTKLNSNGTLVGRGVSPGELNMDLNFSAFNSSINGYSIDKVNLKSHAANRVIDLNLNASSDTAGANFKASFIFDKDTIPSYNINGVLKNFNLATFIKNPKYDSNLNLNINLDGKSFNPDELTGSIKFGVDSSRFSNKYIDHSEIQCSFKKDSAHREILLTSDFVDFKIDGNFSLNKAVELMSYESSTISKIITRKINQLNPLNVVQRRPRDTTAVTVLPIIVDENLKFNYDIKFKDFELIAKLMGNDRMDISGSCGGYVQNQSGNFSITAQLKLDYIIMVQKASTFYISDLSTDINFTRNNHSMAFSKLFGTASITGKRFYSGSNIKSIDADIVFNQNKLIFNTSANIDDIITANAEGVIYMTSGEQKLAINKLSLLYEGIDWTNKDTVKVLLNPDYFKIINCQLHKDTSLISLKGIIESSGKQDLTINAARISGDILEKYLFGLKVNQIKTSGEAVIKIGGEFEKPLMDISVNLKNLAIATSKPSNIKGNATYSDKKLTASFDLLDLTSNENKSLISFKGYLPVDLSFAPVEKRFLQDDKINIQLSSSHFDLSTLGSLIPQVSDQKGILTANISMDGTFKTPIYSGSLSLTDGSFRSVYNNLVYTTGLKLHFADQIMNLDSLVISNTGDTRYAGTIVGSGGITFDGFKPKDIELKFNGDLAVLGPPTKSISPFFYGDLLIGTDGDWLLTKRGDRVFFKGNALMKLTNLVYTTGVETGGLSNKDFDIQILEDTTKIDKEFLRFKQVLTKEKAFRQQNSQNSEKNLNFDYEIGIRAENTATLTFILGQVANQKLIVEIRGDMKYSNVDGQSQAQGVFELLQGSKLEFFKTFEAAGTLRFESDITNPYLDIVATYKSDYVNPHDVTGTTQEIAVKIKIKSPLSELGKNLASNTESIGVYTVSKNGQSDVRDTRYDYADAFSFIIFGKFKDELTAQDKTSFAGQSNAFGSTATSLLGSLLSNFVNTQVGDLINNIQISQYGYYTKFSVSGRIQNFSYSIGGTTETFQSLSKAIFGLRYNFTPRFSMSFDRKDPIGTQYSLDDKILEFLIKYKFEF